MSTSSILKVLTELTALNPSGIVILKPFRPWYGLEAWRSRKVGLRILNALEIENALEAVAPTTPTAQEQALKKEIIARALWSIDGQSVSSKEDVEDYNELHKTELNEVEYRRVFVAAFEQYFLDYLYTLYTELQSKQARHVMGVLQCGICRKTTTVLGEGDRRIEFSTAEFLCADCVRNVVPEDGFDFTDEPRKMHTSEFEVVPTSTSGASADLKTILTPGELTQSNVVKTQSDFKTLDEYKDYLIALADTGGLPRETHTKTRI